MAEAFVKAILDDLNSLIQKEFGLLWGFNREMEKLSSTLSTISAVLEDAEERQFRDRAIKNWLQKLKDASYELDDILDECATEAFRMEYEGQRSTSTKKVHASFSTCLDLKNTFARHSIAKKMNKIRDRLDEIANERVKFHLHEVVVERQARLREMRQTSSIITQPQVYGREEDKEKIVEFLVENACSTKNVSVYPIVGLGGMGKTTLAQLVFNDERVIKHFELKIWICVSEEFDVKRLIKAITESVSRSACDSLDMDPLQKKLQDMLRNKRFLIVLDDVWNENEEEWDKVKYVLDCGYIGSSIVVTTRLKRVASIMGTTSMHHLCGLSQDYCCLLFKQRAFGNNENEEQPDLVKIGMEIVRKCGGVPLAAKTLGSLMRFKREENQWLSVMESELWNLPQDENSILPALRLSYLHLPIELRRCFAFCAVFPKDFIIYKRTLIRLWMANGLISSDGRMEVEKIGSEICDELYWRSFLMNSSDDGHGKPTDYFIMHDLVHDLAKSVMEDEIIDVSSTVKSSSTRFRHVFCRYSNQPFDKLPNNAHSTIRTFMAVSVHRLPKFPYRLNNFPSLRAFVIENCTFSPSISSLISYHKHLRYLNLSGTDIRILPTAICSLPNLQTLDLACCRRLRKLPKHISRLKSLRHLEIHGCTSLSHTPPNIGQLTCLRTLSIFIVDKRRGHHLEELQGLNLGGHLEIQDLQKVRTSVDAKRANLIRKKDLDSLFLCWGENDPQSPEEAELVLEALEPPPNLSCLLIESYEGFSLPCWFDMGILESVVDMTLARCKNISLLPPFLGKLPSLRSLGISGMNSVQYLDHESYDGTSVRGFMSLESLRMKALPNLEKLSREEGREMFPYLSFLVIEKCPKLTLPCLPSIQSLDVRECNEALLKSIRNFSALTKLYLFDNVEMTSFPDGMLQNLNSLKSLTIQRFTKLQELCFDILIGLTTLESLRIVSCYELKCFRIEVKVVRGSTSLKTIDIEDCMKFKSYYTSSIDFTALQSLKLFGDLSELEDDPNGFKNLPSLQDLYLSGRNFTWNWKDYPSSKLAVLPETIKYLPSLESMSISHFPNLRSLPDSIGNLTSLRRLTIRDCPKLTYLPTGIQNLSNLESLRIESCPNLMKKCEKELGEEWHKIAHIPNVQVHANNPFPPFEEREMTKLLLQFESSN